MKKTKWMPVLACVFMCACDKNVVDDAIVTIDPTQKKEFTFSLQGDFVEMTRSLVADEKEMTDIWVLDYDGEGNLLQQLHQGDNTAEGFGQPSMSLAYGSHHLYFIISRGQSPTLNTSAKTISWIKPSDTFYKDYQLMVTGSTSGERTVTMNRVATRFRATIEDVMPENVATVTIAPATWYTGLNYQTGAPTTAVTNYVADLTIPNTYIGQTNTRLSLYCLSGAEVWNTDITITAKTSGNVVVGQATIQNVPLMANRSTDYTGKLFGQQNAIGFTLQEWAEPSVGTW